MAMKIVKLRLKNFKSFKKAEIPFSEGFTSIVGSNASGKSNLLDGIMFAFGATSLKMLRAAKLVDLVNHDASEDYAKVEVELKDKDREYRISRTIDKQGKSVYRLEDKRKTLDEVRSLLGEFGVTAKGHNIVAQGDITRVIEMSPKQRREIIDDMAGLSEFEGKKEEALKKLEKVDQKVKDAGIVFKEREAYLEQLEKEKTAALRYTDLTGELKRSKATIIAKEIKRIKAEDEVAKKKQEKLEKDIEGKSSERSRISGQLSEAEKKLEETNDRLIKAKETIYSTIGKGVEAKKAEIKVANERLSNRESRLNANKNRVHLLKERLRNINSSVSDKELKTREKTTELKSISTELKPLEDREKEKLKSLKEMAEKIAAAENELKEVAEQIAKKHMEFYAKEVESSSLKKEVELILKRIDEINTARKEANLEDRRKAIGKAETEVSEIIKILNKLKNKDELKEDINLLVEKVELLSKEIKEIAKILDFFAKTEDEQQLVSVKDENKKQLAVIGKESETIRKEIESFEKEKSGLEEKIKRSRGMEGATAHEKLNLLREKRSQINEFLASENAELKELKKRAGEIEAELKELDNEIHADETGITSLKESIAGLSKELDGKQHELEKASRANIALEETKQKTATKIENLSKKKNELEGLVERTRKESNELAIELSRGGVKLEDLSEEYRNYEGVKLLEDSTVKELEKRIPKIEKEIEQLGAINMKALQSFDEYYSEVEEVKKKCAKLEEERQAVLEMIDKIELRKMSIFMECFNEVNKSFGKLYFDFFNGEGRLGLTNPENPLEGGLTIEAKYKEDRLKSIDAMSGGEKALTALAFLFAIQSFDPAPFYIFDEADAALDKENSFKLANMIKGISRNAQFIVITHNDALTKMADQLIGVALNKKRSSVIGLKLKEKLGKIKKSMGELEEEDLKDETAPQTVRELETS